MTRWWLTLALVVACKPGAIPLDDTDAADTDLTDEPLPDPPNPFAGAYAGEVSIMIETWGFRMCRGDLDLEIDDQGALTGEGVCTGQSWGGGEQDYDVTVEGQVDPVTGTITDGLVVFQILTGGGGGGGGELVDIDAEIVGNADSADVEADWTVEVSGGGGGGGGGGDTTFSGEINTWPE